MLVLLLSISYTTSIILCCNAEPPRVIIECVMVEVTEYSPVVMRELWQHQKRLTHPLSLLSDSYTGEAAGEAAGELV